MNKVGLISESKGLFPNQGEVLKGTLQLRCRDITHYAGQDHYFKFGETIRLPNGEFLKVSHQDLVYRVHIIIKSSDGESQSLIEYLPSSLFKQAREGDTLSYFVGTQKYELQIIPSTSGMVNPKEFSFDECVETVVENAGKNYSLDFCKLEDVPCGGYGYQGRVDKSTGIFHTARLPPGCFLISRANKFYTLSPETACIQLNQTGVSPVNFKNLKFKDCDSETPKAVVKQNETGILLTIVAPSKPEIEILLDKNKIYITQQPTLELQKLCPTFYHTTLESGSKEIDVSNITAQLTDQGILFIGFPFKTTSNEQPIEISTTSTTTTSTTNTSCTTAHIYINHDVGYGNVLGVCCEPSWDNEPIAFKHNGQGWSGQVPVGKDWKFVILHIGHVIKWENGNNRKCDGKASSFSIDPNTLKFS